MVSLRRCHFIELDSSRPINPFIGKTVRNYLLRQSLWLTPSWFLRLHAGNHPKGTNTQEKSPLRQYPKLTTEPKKCFGIQHLSLSLTLFNAKIPHHVLLLNKATSIQVSPFSMFINSLWACLKRLGEYYYGCCYYYYQQQ